MRFLVACMAGTLLTAGSFGSQPMDENILKAQALIELSPYFRWPEASGTSQAFTITVVGKSPFGTNLEDYARSRTVQGRKIEIQYSSKASELGACQLVFICRSERMTAGRILEWAKGRSVLTVSDDEELLRKGVMVGLIAEGGFLRLYVNPHLASLEKFTISSQLLRLAKILD